MWLNYACNLQNQNFNKSAKFIAHKIFVLYSIHYQSLLVTICHNSHMLSHTYYSPLFSCSHTYLLFQKLFWNNPPKSKTGKSFFNFNDHCICLLLCPFKTYIHAYYMYQCQLTHLFHKVVQFVAANNYYQNH